MAEECEYQAAVEAAVERLVQSIRDTIAALEQLPFRTAPQERLLVNLRGMLAGV